MKEERKCEKGKRHGIGSIGKRAAVFCLATVMALCNVLPVWAAGGLHVAPHTQEEIRAYANRDGVSLQETPEYTQAPQATAPFALGKVSDQTLGSAIKLLNQIRYIAGLSYDVALDARYNELAQAASLANYANQKMSHYPTQPAGMPDDMFALAQTGAASSNIAWSSARNWSLNNIIATSWMEDGDSSNIDRVGHRRWLLNPKMGKTGFGVVTGENGSHFAVYAHDKSNQGASEYGVAWPAQNMPVEYFNTHFPWSVSMGQQLDASAVKVTLTRQRDGRQWQFSQGCEDGEFYVNNDSYGQKGCIIFKPYNRDVGSYQDGDSYDVQIQGVPGGEIAYTVNFFRMYKMEQVLLDPEALSFKEGEKTVTLQAVISPQNASDKQLSWEITDPSVAVVVPVNDKAYVTPQKAGNAQILVKDSQGRLMATCEVTVNHVPGEEPSCTEAQTCTECGQELQPALGHTPVAEEAVAATCTKDGKTEGSRCSACGEELVKSKKIPALGHNWGSQEVKPATAAEDGMLSKACKACGEKEEEKICRLASIRLSASSYVYDGTEKKPAVTVIGSDGKQVDRKFYTVTYQNNREVGTATAVASFTGHYAGTMEAAFTIRKQSDSKPEPKPEQPQPQKKNIAKSAKITLARTSYTYNGKGKKPSVTVSVGSKKLKEKKEYKLSYQKNKNVGKATVTVTGIGSYTGKVTKSFKILPQGTSISKLAGKSKRLDIRWKRQPRQTAGYQVQYSTSSKFTKGATVLKTVKKASTTKLTVKKLKPRKRYYVRVRTYQTVQGVTYASAWSKVKRVVTKK